MLFNEWLLSQPIEYKKRGACLGHLGVILLFKS